jgi:hypothetical protein
LRPYAEIGSGDWYWLPNGDLKVTVTCDGDKNIWDDEESFLCALHELVEARLCFKHGVTQGAVDAFDNAYQGDDPGSDPAAPYQSEHRAACLIEFTMAMFLGKHDYGRME